MLVALTKGGIKTAEKNSRSVSFYAALSFFGDSMHERILPCCCVHDRTRAKYNGAAKQFSGPPAANAVKAA
eukprot:4908535-Pleurochrysis_carterae.AAC.6